MNEEIGIHVVPMVMRSHEEYFVVDSDTAVCACVRRYKIPYRAIGNKLRDVQYINTDGTSYEMARVSIETRPEFSNDFTSNQYRTFYVQNDDVVLMENLHKEDCMLSEVILENLTLFILVMIQVQYQLLF